MVLPVLSLELTTLVDVVVWFEMTVGGELVVVVPLLDETLLRVIVIKAVLLVIIWVECIDWIGVEDIVVSVVFVCVTFVELVSLENVIVVGVKL